MCGNTTDSPANTRINKERRLDLTLKLVLSTNTLLGLIRSIE
jgi:hypothetical protein